MKPYESPEISFSSIISDRAIALKDTGDNFVSDIWLDDTESEDEE